MVRFGVGASRGVRVGVGGVGVAKAGEEASDEEWGVGRLFVDLWRSDRVKGCQRSVIIFWRRQTLRLVEGDDRRPMCRRRLASVAANGKRQRDGGRYIMVGVSGALTASG